MTRSISIPPPPDTSRLHGKALAAWVCYRDLGASRTLEETATTLGYASRDSIKRWYREYNFPAMARQWDAHRQATLDADALKHQQELIRARREERLQIATSYRMMSLATLKQHYSDGTLPPNVALAMAQFASKEERADLGELETRIGLQVEEETEVLHQPAGSPLAALRSLSPEKRQLLLELLQEATGYRMDEEEDLFDAAYLEDESEHGDERSAVPGLGHSGAASRISGGTEPLSLRA
jgi:hypothetical protein